jgi:hypothetical protein
MTGLTGFTGLKNKSNKSSKIQLIRSIINQEDHGWMSNWTASLRK